MLLRAASQCSRWAGGGGAETDGDCPRVGVGGQRSGKDSSASRSMHWRAVVYLVGSRIGLAAVKPNSSQLRIGQRDLSISEGSTTPAQSIGLGFQHYQRARPRTILVLRVNPNSVPVCQKPVNGRRDASGRSGRSVGVVIVDELHSDDVRGFPRYEVPVIFPLEWSVVGQPGNQAVGGRGVCGRGCCGRHVSVL